MTNHSNKLPSLFDLWARYKFSVRTLAILAEVPEETIKTMMYGRVSREVAQKVLDQLSPLIHWECTLETVYVELREEHGENKSEVARLLAQINSEYEAAQQSLTGLAQGIGQHRFITKRMEHIGQCVETLCKIADESTMRQVMTQLGELEVAKP